jgi:predicted kinase
VCGLPGSGKTAHANALVEELNAFRLSADDWMDALDINLWNGDIRARIEAIQWELAQELLRHGQVVIIEWGTWGRSERDTLREGARALGAAVELHYLHEPLDVLWSRIEARGLESPPIKREHLKEWAEVIQVPTADEFALYDSRPQVAQQ